MSIEGARLDLAGIVDAMVAAHSSYLLAVEMPNRDLIDQTTQTNPYLKVQLKWLNGQQMDLADKPLVGQFGQILISACVRKGAGEKGANELLDFCTPYFELKDLTVIRTKIFEPQNFVEFEGWWYANALVNFWFHRVSV